MKEDFLVFVPKILDQREYFSFGHRACQGCGEALAIRLVLKATGYNVVVVNATGCSEIFSSCYPQSAWNIPWFHCAFENTAAVASGVERALKVLSRKGKYSGKLPKVIGFAGDGGTADIGLQALSGAFERGDNILYVCYDNEAYMNCLSLSTLIFTKDGLKKITDIKVGDEVYAFDRKNYRITSKKCSGIFNNGYHKVFTLETLHHSIKATSNHPFLVLKRNGRGKKNILVWKKLQDLNIGDQIVVLKNLDTSEPFKFKEFKKVKKGDYKVNRLKEFELPEFSTPELMKYLGIYVGDGWIRKEKGEIGFALCKGTKERKEFIELHNKIFGLKYREDENYIYINSINLANFIDTLGFGHSAKNKTIPDWIFTLPEEQKEAFIEGLLLSDGYSLGRSNRYVSASYELLVRLRLLLQTLNYRVGKIHWQIKKKGTICGKRELLKDSEYGYICFSRKRKWNIEKYLYQYKYKNFLIENKYFELEKVKSIKSNGLYEPTLDLRVEDEHNFIANGIVVHNTGIQRSGATPFGASTTTSPAGKKSIGQKTWKKDMPKIAIAHNIPYVATACPSYPLDLINKVKKATTIEGPSYIHILSVCPTGWRCDSSLTIKLGRLAVKCGIFPLYEYENGKYKLNFELEELIPVKEYLKLQGRFRHLTEDLIEKIQKEVTKKYQELKELCEK
jgi:pyruvate/2-oxoacid:ferredoxin oxidoreductase beta subunit/intein/homing endonuclease